MCQYKQTVTGVALKFWNDLPLELRVRLLLLILQKDGKTLLLS